MLALSATVPPPRPVDVDPSPHLNAAAQRLMETGSVPFPIKVFRMDSPFVHRFIRGPVLHSPADHKTTGLSAALVSLRVNRQEASPVCIVLWYPDHTWIPVLFEGTWGRVGAAPQGWAWVMAHEAGHCLDSWHRQNGQEPNLPPVTPRGQESIADAWATLWTAAQWPEVREAWKPVLLDWRSRHPEDARHQTSAVLKQVVADPSWGQPLSQELLWQSARRLAQPPSESNVRL